MGKKHLRYLRVGLSFLLVMAMGLLVGCGAQKSAATEPPESEQDQAEKPVQPPAETPAQAPAQPPAQPPTDTGYDAVEVSSETGTAVGDTAPDFELPLLSGETVRLSDLRGKPVLINFMATWCPPCQKEFPAVQQIYEEYGDRIQLLAISLGEPREDVDNSFSTSPYTFPIAFDAADALYQDYQVDFIPQSYFINGDGVIVDYLVGGSSYEDFKTRTDKLLK